MYQLDSAVHINFVVHDNVRNENNFWITCPCCVSVIYSNKNRTEKRNQVTERSSRKAKLMSVCVWFKLYTDENRKVRVDGDFIKWIRFSPNGYYSVVKWVNLMKIWHALRIDEKNEAKFDLRNSILESCVLIKHIFLCVWFFRSVVCWFFSLHSSSSALYQALFVCFSVLAFAHHTITLLWPNNTEHSNVLGIGFRKKHNTLCCYCLLTWYCLFSTRFHIFLAAQHNVRECIFYRLDLRTVLMIVNRTREQTSRSM